VGLICEFLASQGYMVLASPSVGRNTTLMTDDVDGLKSQARDILFLIDYAKGQPDADLEAVAVTGYSWGGLSNVYAATQDKRIKALVCLDGSIRYYVSVAWDAGIHPEQMTVPLLIFMQVYIALKAILLTPSLAKGVQAWFRRGSTRMSTRSSWPLWNIAHLLQ